MIKVRISDRCEPYMYHTSNNLHSLKIGDVISATFTKKTSKVKKEYIGKTITFFVNNILDYNFYSSYRRIALIPLNKKDKFKNSDVLIVDETNRFESLMIDLYPENRRPYAGWKNKKITFEKLKEKVTINNEPTLTLRKIEFNKNSSFIHPKNCFEHTSLRCFGGISRESHEKLEDALKYNHTIKIIGYETPIPKVNTTEFMYQDYHFRVTIKDLTAKKTYFFRGYLFEETVKEFNSRLFQYVEQAIKVVKEQEYKLTLHNSLYNVFSIASHYLANCKQSDVDLLLDKYSKKDSQKIIDKCIAHLEYEKKM
jgi:hypothetical protein